MSAVAHAIAHADPDENGAMTEVPIRLGMMRASRCYDLFADSTEQTANLSSPSTAKIGATKRASRCPVAMLVLARPGRVRPGS
jgi:hypothetical protein